ncbi:MAG: tyrosine-type recombinase/integrase family protein, partial [Abditibacteriota bacterium]|nr:tyrosine-type recombinase/integrase family protein [Abditibacteriota bacterium]
MARRAKGEGSLYKAKDNSWVYQYQEGGKRKTKRFQKRADATAFIKALSAAQDEAKESVPVPTPPEQETPERAAETAQKQPRKRSKTQVLTVGAWMDRWLENYAKPTVKLSTYASYELYIRAHVKPLIGDRYMNTLSVDDLQDFFNNRGASGNLVTGEGLSPKTLTNMRNMLHLAFDQAVKNRILKFNPIEGVRIPRAVNKEMRVLSREEQNKLIEAARTSEELASFGIIFDLFTGLRIGEICGLRWRNVQLEQQCFHVRETRNRLPNYDPNSPTTTTVQTFPTTKTDNSRRTVYLMD